MSLSSSRSAHKAALPPILCLFATASPTLIASLARSVSTERCACPQLVCDTDVFLRRDAYPADPVPPLLCPSSLCCTHHQFTTSDRGYEKVTAHSWVLSRCPPWDQALHSGYECPEQPCFPVGSLKPRSPVWYPSMRDQ
ncbi:Nuclear poly(A) polymerase 3 [Dissostichus eleginoides]|uniref:Nuclear poly(A) polymerase 3 n=1 Tax=Dissostichus eleginoides TaxID=100907 RepID=A0AAD9F8D7_DISEL|nr:Nuclear poly(A) polymerase 3 [Dissostichus eleginoides]